MSEATSDRRRQVRRTASSDEPLARTRMRTGTELRVIDVSDLGMLVEGSARLGPGARIDAHVITRSGRVLVRSRVVRAFVSLLRGDTVVYRAALVFDQPLDTSPFGYSLPVRADESSTASGT